MSCRLIISPTAKEVVVTTVLEVGLSGIRWRVKQAISDYSYGEFVFYQHGLPEFYCSLFLDNGQLSNLGEIVKRTSSPAEDVIAKLIYQNGLGKVSAVPDNLKGLVLPFAGERKQKCRVRVIVDCLDKSE